MSDTGAIGDAYYLLFNGHVLNTNYRSTSHTETIDTVDQSAGADTVKTYLTTLKDGTKQATIKHKAGDTAVWGWVVPGEEGTLEWGEEGTTAGKPRHYANAIVMSRAQSASYSDLVTIDVSWQFSGAVTDGTY